MRATADPPRNLFLTLSIFSILARGKLSKERKDGLESKKSGRTGDDESMQRGMRRGMQGSGSMSMYTDIRQRPCCRITCLLHTVRLPLVPDGASAVTGMYVREGVGNLEGGRRGAEPPASGPRSGNFCRFETLEGHFPSQN